MAQKDCNLWNLFPATRFAAEYFIYWARRLEKGIGVKFAKGVEDPDKREALMADKTKFICAGLRKIPPMR